MLALQNQEDRSALDTDLEVFRKARPKSITEPAAHKANLVMHDRDLNHRPWPCSLLRTVRAGPGQANGGRLSIISSPAALVFHLRVYDKVIIVLLHKYFVAKPLHSSDLRFSEALPFALVKEVSQ